MKTITVEWLQSKEACNHQIEEFAEMFGDAAPITESNLQRAHSLDLEWLSERILTAPALEEYAKATAAAREEYEKAAAPAWEEYKKAEAPALEEYRKAEAPAWEEYKKAAATALWDAWSNDAAREGEQDGR